MIKQQQKQTSQWEKNSYILWIDMAIKSREQYIMNTFNRMHSKLDSAFEDAFDGEFEECRNTINSLIYDLKDFKKSMEA